MNEKHAQPSPEVHAEIKTKIATYQPKLLNPQQTATMLPRMRELVLAADPKSIRDTKCLLSVLARFLVDVVPAEGGNVDDFLTNVESLALNAVCVTQRSTRSVASRKLLNATFQN